MKKEYKTPEAEKVEFDYTESVVACNSNKTDESDSQHDLGDPYYKCACTAYYV